MEQLNPTQNLAIDLLILAFDEIHQTVRVYAPLRTNDFLQNERALPGVLLKPHESIQHSVSRAISTKTPIDVDNLSTFIIQELPAQTDPERDPRGHVVSVPILVFTSINLANEDMSDWLEFKPGLSLAFDHTQMINLAFDTIAKYLKQSPLPLLLANGPLTLDQAKHLIAHFDESFKTVSPSNFKRMFPVEHFLVETDYRPETLQKGRQPKYYRVQTERISPIFR